MNAKAIIIRGNGDTHPDEIWFPWLKEQLEKISIPTTNVGFPDPDLARMSEWVPFIEKLGADKSTILVGHSSGALAAMRFVETHEILGLVLVAPCYTDLGDEHERASGYFDKPWEWESIKRNQQWIVQFSSPDDPYIPISEARYVHEQLDSRYFELPARGHFGGDRGEKQFPELLLEIKSELGALDTINEAEPFRS